LTAPPIRTLKALVSKALIAPMPLRPARMPAHEVGTSSPSGLTIPSPVMTTRRLLKWRWFLVAAAALPYLREASSFST
jgi:hypothetical protein